MMRKSAICLALCLTLSGCFYDEGPYPEVGQGGFAEWQAIENPRARALQDRLEAAQRRGAERYAAAAFADASLLLTRCRRELAGGLMIDARTDLDRLERQIAAMEAALERAPRRNYS
jgi:hypothetical protein